MVLLLQDKLEVVFRALVIAIMQHHFATAARIFAGPTGDCKNRVLAVKEWTCDVYLSIGQRVCPGTFPGFANCGAEAITCITPHHFLVGFVINFICEGKNVANAVILSTCVGDRIACGVIGIDNTAEKK